MALRTALTSGLQFGGCIGLSCYLPGDIDNIDVPDTPNIQTPIFQVIIFKQGYSVRYRFTNNL